MSKRGPFLCLCGLAVAGVCLYTLPSLFPVTPVLEIIEETDNKYQEGFLVNTPGCQIPDVDPFDSSIRHLVTKVGPISCNATPALTYTEGNIVRINKTALQLYYNGDLENCIYQSIHRIQNTDDLYTYNKNSTWFTEDVEIYDEYIRVACYSKQSDLIYTNFHAFVLEKPDVDVRCNQKFKSFQDKIRPVETFNLVVMGVDSISRLNFIRQMPKTRTFLIKELNAIELKGYNKVADNTYVNLVPMFAGKFVNELPWDESSRKSFDDYNFIWKNFSQSGYRTLYAEDAPQIAIFNYAKEGFYKSPTDYYLRPFSLALEDHGSIWNTNHDCVGPKLETQVVLDYVHDFMTKFKQKPFYAFSFITRLTHDNINKAGSADQPYFEFFRQLHKEGHIDNSVLIFFSDHGMRFGTIRSTYIGKLEERLPFMYLVFPKWFYKKYPNIAQNLRTNENRLTTPFDIYETLVDLLNFDGRAKETEKPSRGISLFSAIPGERTCKYAAILPHWCTCHQQTPVRTDNHIVIIAVNEILQFINKELKPYSQICAYLYLDDITDALLMVVTENNIRKTAAIGSRSQSIVDYLLTFKTKPGGGLFEATVRYMVSDSNFQIIGDISRINEYGKQSDCINQHRYKKYCFCNSH